MRVRQWAETPCRSRWARGPPLARPASLAGHGRTGAGRDPPSATRTFVGQPGHLRQPWGPGWALVGDAGSWKDPISAHGLTDALRDAELLGRAIVATSIDEQRDEDAYGTYERTRNRLTVPILTAADEIASFQWSDDRIAELLLELSAAMNDELDVITGFDDRQPIHPPTIAAPATR